jgi:hypothetical protein
MSDFLLVIPAFREHLRLPPFLTELVSTLSGAPFTTEIQIVDDGSPPAEQQALLLAVATGRFNQCTVPPPACLPANHGKGETILIGWRRAGDSSWLAFVDADGSIPASEVLRVFSLALEERAQAKNSCFFASRILMLGRTVKRRFLRHLCGRVFATVVANLFKTHVYDSQCGLKVLPRAWFLRVNPLLQGAGLCFDIELLVALQHSGASIIEVPIDWEDKPGGSVSVLTSGLPMLWGAWLLSRRSRTPTPH